MSYSLPGPRASGRTTRQLQALPIGGWYFCHNPNLMKSLAKAIDRTDIQFHSMDELFDPARFSGYVIPGIDVDHFVWENFYADTIVENLKKLEPCVLRARHLSPKPVVVKSPICPCGIDRRDCDYHK